MNNQKAQTLQPSHVDLSLQGHFAQHLLQALVFVRCTYFVWYWAMTMTDRNFTGHNITLISIHVHKETMCWLPINVMKLLEHGWGRKSCFVVCPNRNQFYARKHVFVRQRSHFHIRCQVATIRNWCSQLGPICHKCDSWRQFSEYKTTSCISLTLKFENFIHLCKTH